jgi:flagellar basal-body rod protein FlgF
MADGIYTALTGAVAQQHSLDVIANNVANVTTAGYRADRAVFSEFLAGEQRKDVPHVSADGKDPKRPDRFVQVATVSHDYTNGNLKLTGNPLDMALNGDGFFVVQTPQGDRLTRAGSFMLQKDGTLSTPEGFPVLGSDDKPIKLTSNNNIQVGTDGTINADEKVMAKFKLVRVEDPAALQKENDTRFVVSDSTKLAVAKDVSVNQGSIESSNVNAVAGLNELITVSRSFDALQRVIETFQKIDDRTARDLGARS